MLVTLALACTCLLGPPKVPGATDTLTEREGASVSTNLPGDSLSERGSWNFNDLGGWIWAPEILDRQTCRFWNAIEIPPGRISRARLRITADNEYILFLDGHELGRDAEWRHLYEYDLTPLLSPGRHVLAVRAYNSVKEAGLALGLSIRMEDGRLIRVKSDSTWRLVPDGVKNWEEISSPSSEWRSARVIAPFGGQPWGKPGAINLVPPLQRIVIPFWQTDWFHLTVLALMGVLAVVSFRLMTQLALRTKEKELLQRERARIARDIHDDLGLHVTQLVLQGEVAQSELPPGSKTRGQFEHMCEDAREALRAMDEILWAINPRRDTFREFVTYVCGYAQKFLKHTPIQCVLDVEPEITSAAFDLPLRRNLLLAVKEALNNVARHSQATELHLKIRWQGHGLVVTLEDNGRGFDPDRASTERNGLTNMAQRMSEVGGNFRVSSQPGKGCRVELSMPLKQMRRRFWWPGREVKSSLTGAEKNQDCSRTPGDDTTSM
ncbi:MAG: hypothetical protein H7Y43_00295 [Akkermansiaceae bacterium]|nr:hypothetical protein [Verrucomicrobiales bacterium]